ncbi:MAG: NHLP family bacteriocin export ABC transporter peptidase/permease/ATPase subunit [Acidobacteriota bacterium]
MAFTENLERRLRPFLRRDAGRRATPTLLQLEAVECGPASLGILLAHHGRRVPLTDLRAACGVSRDGSTASNVVKAARRYGMIADGRRKDMKGVREVEPPFIAFWNFNHFLVVEGFDDETVYLNDPAGGHRSVTLDEFDESFTGVILEAVPGPDFEPGGRKPSVAAALARRLRGSRSAVVFSVLIGLFLVVPQLATAVFAQIFVDSVLIQGKEGWLRPLIFAVVITALVRGILTFLQRKYLRRLQIKLAVVLSSQYMWHVLRLPAKFYAQRFAGEIANRTLLNDKVADKMSGKLASTVIDVTMVAFYAIVMIQYDLVLTAIVVGFGLINFLALRAVAERRTEANMRMLQDGGKLQGQSIAGIQGMEMIKAAALEGEFFARWAGYQAKASGSRQDFIVANLRLGVLPNALMTLSTAVVLIVGGLRVTEGLLTIGMLVAFQSLTQSFLEPVNKLVELGSLWQELEGDLARLDDVLDNPTDAVSARDDAEAKVVQGRHRLRGELELRNVTFGYNELEEPLIQDLSLKLEPGQRVALVGGSGSGKSTIAKLIAGLYEPWEGEILFDGLPREEHPRSVLTSSMAMVEQDIMLFEGTVRDNLTLWDSTVPSQDPVQGARDAVIHDVVVGMQGAYDGVLLEGGRNLSGGQRQRLEIARALTMTPSLLVMDEATSALDADTENSVYRNLRRRGCSCVVVAHRLSTIRDCDEIVVLDRGSVVQRGQHDSLIQEDGAYRSLLQRTS